MNGALILAPVGSATYALNESDANFSPEGLALNSPNLVANELTVIWARRATGLRPETILWAMAKV